MSRFFKYTYLEVQSLSNLVSSIHTCCLKIILFEKKLNSDLCPLLSVYQVLEAMAFLPGFFLVVA